ncbi:hypothetical protein GCM10011491_18490 [Brucella endophytica]|uniref:Uncharacterized protein n=1 Tax=Brucella endophytica TaxID=1963359 RepID=A0A916SA81_9HYPH|nr:hypothetical protein GCM10011491_18490 [Brucella endophytica]
MGRRGDFPVVIVVAMVVVIMIVGTAAARVIFLRTTAGAFAHMLMLRFGTAMTVRPATGATFSMIMRLNANLVHHFGPLGIVCNNAYIL